MRALVDTCVIIDALQNREPFAKEAKSIFISVANKEFSGYITSKSAADIYYIMHRATHSDKESRATLSKLFKLFTLIDTGAIDCLKAIPSTVSDYEDAIMTETAIREKMDCIITRNTRDYLKADIEVVSPKLLLKRIKE